MKTFIESDIKIYPSNHELAKYYHGEIRCEQSDMVFKQLWWQKRGLSYTASGYGSKIPTSYMIKIGKILYRIYCICYSNSGTSYINYKGKKVIIN